MSGDEAPARSTVLLARLGPLLFVLTLFVQGGTIVLALTTRHGAQPFAVQPVLAALASSAVALAFGLVGAILTARLPRHRIGWLLNIAGFCIAINAWPGGTSPMPTPQRRLRFRRRARWGRSVS